MQMPEDDADSRAEQLAAAIRQTRLIVAAIAAGGLLFAAIVLGMSASRGPLVGPNQSLAGILGVLSVLLLVANIVVGLVMARGIDARVRRGEEVPMARITAAVITFAALVQAPTLLAVVAALFGGPPYLLIAMVGSAVLLVQWIRLPDRMRDMAGYAPAGMWH